MEPVGHRCRAFALVVCLLLAGCGSLGRYAKDRLLDLTDIVDVKYPTELHGVGLLARVEATDFLASGLGVSSLLKTGEWYGRRHWCNRDPRGPNFQLLVLGLDGIMEVEGDSATLLVFNVTNLGLPLIDRFRIGGELVLPLMNVGLYLNLGEIVDLLLGFATLDPAFDDGLPKGSPIEARAAPSEEKAPAESDTEGSTAGRGS